MIRLFLALMCIVNNSLIVDSGNATVTIKLVKSPHRYDLIDDYGVYSEKIEFKGNVYNLIDTEYLYKKIFYCANLKSLYNEQVKQKSKTLSDNKFQIIKLCKIDRRIFVGDFYCKSNSYDTLIYSFHLKCKLFVILDDLEKSFCEKGFINPTISFMGKKTDYIIPEIEERQFPFAAIADVDTVFGINEYGANDSMYLKSDIRSVLVKSAW